MYPFAHGRVIGALFLAAFILYGLGSTLSGSDTTTLAALGAALVVANSLAVATIGLLALGVFSGERVGARAYLSARLFEAVVLAAALLPAIDTDRAFWVAMLVLGAGSVPFCLALARQRLVPRPFAVLGILGYPVLALGAVLELGGLAVGYWFFIPGGLFEVALGVLLTLRGFRAHRPPINAPGVGAGV